MVRNRQSLLTPAALLAVAAATMLTLAACSSPGSAISNTESSSAPIAANAVQPTLVGMHVEGVEGGAWPSAPFGALRLWDNGTAWSQIELKPGDFKWDNLEGALENAESKGMKQVLMVLGSTPEWNAKTVGASDYPGPGAASAPKSLAAWDKWVTEVATRYKGRINAYEVWNEANLKQFWNGTPQEMAELTKRAYDIIKKIDPSATVVSASPSTRLTSSFKRFFPAYLKALAAQDWPVDVIAIHTYPAADGDPTARGVAIKAVRAELKKAGAPAKLPLWDTELNYGLAGPGNNPKQEITGARAAGWVVRTYVDDLRYDVARSYWYIWTLKPYDLLGIQAYNGSGGAEQGFFALNSWVVGSVFEGCKNQAGGVVVCDFTRDGQPSVIAWAEKRPTQYTVPADGQLVCDPLANCQKVTPGSTITLTDVPIRVYTQA